MTKAEVAYNKMCDKFGEEGKGNVFLSSLIWKEFDLAKCSVCEDTLTLSFTDGTEQHLIVTDCNSDELEGILSITDKTDRKQEIAHLF